MSPVPKADDWLREYQRWMDTARLRSKAKRILYVAPTATGKTHLIAEACFGEIGRSRRTLVVVHKRHLVRQTIRRLAQRGIDEKWAIGGPDDINERPVVVATVQSLCRRDFTRRFDLVVVDEAHHVPAKSWGKVITAAGASRLLGATATPARLDGKPLGDVFDEIIECPLSALELIGEGFISLARIFTVAPADFADLREVKRRRGDYDVLALEERMNRPKLVGDIVTHWQKLAQGRPTIVFASGVAHMKSLVRAFCEADIAAEWIDGTTSEDERQQVIARVRAGETKVVVNVEVFIEGLDVDVFRCAVLARPTLSLSLYLQMCGRVLRPGPVQPLILDHAGNALVHGAPEEPRSWSLSKIPTRTRPVGEARRRHCPECNELVYTMAVTCPTCGTQLRNAAEAIPTTKLSLLEELQRAGIQRHPSVSSRVIRGRIRHGNWSLERAATTPVRPGRAAIWQRWKARSQVKRSTFEARLRAGWSDKKAALTPKKAPQTAWNAWKQYAATAVVRRTCFLERIRNGLTPMEAASRSPTRGHKHREWEGRAVVPRRLFIRRIAYGWTAKAAALTPSKTTKKGR